MLPTHGQIDCQACFANCNKANYEPHEKWLMRNDPGAWGSQEPDILILGFSKGSTQANIYQNGDFNDVAFGGKARARLNELCKKIGVLNQDADISSEISNPDSNFAFGSLVRCSLTREDKLGKHQCSGELILKSFKEIPEILSRCSEKFLKDLPAKTRLVLMLGVTDRYMDECFKLMLKLYPKIKRINSVAYGDEERLFVHITHPSPGNGHFKKYVQGDRKFLEARKSLSELGDFV